jgi:hypothetical protein
MDKQVVISFHNLQFGLAGFIYYLSLSIFIKSFNCWNVGLSGIQSGTNKNADVGTK